MTKTVCIQGLGFVGAAMAAAVSLATSNNQPLYNVIGLDLDTSEGNKRIQAINEGRFPFDTDDSELNAAISSAVKSGNLRATSDKSIFGAADIVISSINLDLVLINNEDTVDFHSYLSSIDDVAMRIKPNTLFIIESTVPPGTTSRLVKPLFEKRFKERKFKNAPFIAHSYERVMPGPNYLNSISNFWRVYSGINQESADAAELFLSSFINTTDFPLRRLQMTEESETAKVLENSYRAVNIAFIDEWTSFSEKVGMDLFSILEAIKDRPTHNNIMLPGFGVGGYCLTKDPLFSKIAADKIFDLKGLTFPFSSMAVKVNNAMPHHIVDLILEKNKNKANFKVLILGVSYKEGVSDTRYSPSETAFNALIKYTSNIDVQDYSVSFWNELNLIVQNYDFNIENYDVLLFTVRNKTYQTIDFSKLEKEDLQVFDSNHVLSDKQISSLVGKKIYTFITGKGEQK